MEEIEDLNTFRDGDRKIEDPRDYVTEETDQVIGMLFNHGQVKNRRGAISTAPDSNRSNIRKLLYRGNRKNDRQRNKAKTKATYWPGVYAFTQDYNDSEIVVGQAFSWRSGLYIRLHDKYSKSFSMKDEFWLKFLIITHPKGAKFDVPTAYQSSPSTSEEVEKRLYDELPEAERSVNSKEWRFIDSEKGGSSVMINALVRMLNRSKKLWLAVVFFDQLAWKIIVNDGRRNVTQSDFKVTEADNRRLLGSLKDGNTDNFPSINSALGRNNPYPVGGKFGQKPGPIYKNGRMLRKGTLLTEKLVLGT